MSPELAGAHESGDCLVDCPHPDCVWVGAADLATFGLCVFDDVEGAAEVLEVFEFGRHEPFLVL